MTVYQLEQATDCTLYFYDMKDKFLGSSLHREILEDYEDDDVNFISIHDSHVLKVNICRGLNF